MKYTLVSTTNVNEKSKIGRIYAIAEKPSGGMLALCAMGSDSCTHFSVDLLLTDILLDVSIETIRTIQTVNHRYVFKEERPMYYYKILVNGSNHLTEIAMTEEITEATFEKEWLVTDKKSMFRTDLILIVYQSTKEDYEAAIKQDEENRKRE